ncbi:fluoride efflux transporter FluC [Corynebacterium kalidii]
MTGEISLLAALAVAFGGGVGSWLRWRVDGLVSERTATDVPVALLVVNTVGSLVLGVLLGLTDTWWPVALVGTGLCGGFTTFSTASVEGMSLLRRRRTVPAVVALAGMAVLAVGAFALGYLAVSW